MNMSKTIIMSNAHAPLLTVIVESSAFEISARNGYGDPISTKSITAESYSDGQRSGNSVTSFTNLEDQMKVMRRWVEEPALNT
ncbi:jg9387 [Pararge aegeria aegeria]|uniref:Jg9387 protein n=1 Tax=Pararge aegeria aegeria TaxID=348720 RepID=A0A8S4S6U0_9NEOP|nr:jg9387 [Pararge aegeria aegeria]